MRPVALAALAVSVCFAFPSTARAAESYDNCEGFIDSVPTTISTQGVWCLRGDISTKLESGAAITVATNNVTIDCNEFKLGNLGASTGNTAFGVQVPSRNTVTVRRCNIRGFGVGVVFSGSGTGHVVEDNRIESSRYNGMFFGGEASIVRRNLVTNTVSPTVGVAIYAMGNIDILDNTIDFVESQNGDDAIGIVLSLDESGTVRRNTIRNILNPKVGGKAIGILMASAGSFGMVDDNVVVHPPLAQASDTTGIACASAVVVARNNVVTAYEDDIVDCALHGNIVQ